MIKRAARAVNTLLEPDPDNWISTLKLAIKRMISKWKFKYVGNTQGTTARVVHNGRISYIKMYRGDSYKKIWLFNRMEFRHKNLISYRYLDSNKYLMPNAGITLGEYVEKGNKLTLSHIKQIFDFSSYLHERGASYEDLHVNNVCIDGDKVTFIDLESIRNTNYTSMPTKEVIKSRLEKLERMTKENGLSVEISLFYSAYITEPWYSHVSSLTYNRS